MPTSSTCERRTCIRLIACQASSALSISIYFVHNGSNVWSSTFTHESIQIIACNDMAMYPKSPAADLQKAWICCGDPVAAMTLHTIVVTRASDVHVDFGFTVPAGHREKVERQQMKKMTKNRWRCGDDRALRDHDI